MRLLNAFRCFVQYLLRQSSSLSLNASYLKRICLLFTTNCTPSKNVAVFYFIRVANSCRAHLHRDRREGKQKSFQPLLFFSCPSSIWGEISVSLTDRWSYILHSWPRNHLHVIGKRMCASACVSFKLSMLPPFPGQVNCFLFRFGIRGRSKGNLGI